MFRSASSTSCPSSGSRRAASSAAATQSAWGAIVVTKGAWSARCAAVPAACRPRRRTGAPAAAPSTATSARDRRSRRASRRCRARCARSRARWRSRSRAASGPGPTGVRPRVGLSPNRPQHEAGMRIEPPPSLACAIGTMPAATAAAAPPLEPPGRDLQVPRVARRARTASARCTAGCRARAVAVLPKTIAPARRKRSTSVESRAGLEVRQEPAAGGCAARPRRGVEILEQQRHAANGASDGGSAAASRAGLLVQRRDDRVDARIDPLGARDRLLDQLGGRHLARGGPGPRAPGASSRPYSAIAIVSYARRIRRRRTTAAATAATAVAPRTTTSTP